VDCPATVMGASVTMPTVAPVPATHRRQSGHLGAYIKKRRRRHPQVDAAWRGDGGVSIGVTAAQSVAPREEIYEPFDNRLLENGVETVKVPKVAT
jgi:hypothetical protein